MPAPDVPSSDAPSAQNPAILGGGAGDHPDLFSVLFGAPTGESPNGQSADNWALASLLAANLLPILLAMLFGWSVGDVVTFYWLENIIIGLWVIPRLLIAQGGVPLHFPELPQADQSVSMAGQGKWFLIPFFCCHYFFFCFVHGVFVSVFASGAITGNPSGPLPFDPPAGGSWPGPLVLFQFFYGLLSNSLGGLSTGGLIAVVGLVLSHGVSFFRNFVGHGEYQHTHPIIEMFRPYPRIVVLHIGIMAGGFATLLLGSPLLLVIVLMVGKTLLDAKLHLASHATKGTG